jgi:hypothetical protein
MSAPIILAALTLGFYWKLVFTGQYRWFDSADMANIELPRLQFQARAMRAHEFPLWVPNTWAGQPLLGPAQPGPVYPFNLLFCRLAYRRGSLNFAAFNWYYVFIHFLAALFCYGFAREVGRGRAASIAAGCAFSFSGFLAECGWLDLANGAIWIPLVFLFLHRALRGERAQASAAASGFFAGLSLLSGHHEVPVLACWAAVLVWMAAALRNWRVLRLFALFAIVLALTSAVQTLPTYEYGSLAVRWTGLPLPQSWNETIPYFVVERYSMPFRAVAGVVFPASGEGARAVHVGIVVTVLALLGLAVYWREAAARRLSALALGSLLFALGGNTPFHGVLFSWLPLLGQCRVPVRALSLFSFAMAGLFAFGIDAAQSGRASKWLRRAAPLAALALIEWWTSVAIPNRYAEGYRSPLAELSRYDDLVQFLRSEPQPTRVRVNDNDIEPNLGEWAGFDTLYGMGPAVTSNVWRSELHTARAQRLFGVTHYFGREAEHPGQVPVFTGHSGVRVFRTPNPLPRAWIVHASEVAATEMELRARIADPGFDPQSKAILLGKAGPSLERCGGEEPVQVIRRTSNEVYLRARAGCRGLLVLGETYYPGWQAAVAGARVPVHEVYGVFRGVVVPAGEHEVVFRYRPLPVYAGAVLSLLGCLATLALAWRARRA